MGARMPRREGSAEAVEGNRTVACRLMVMWVALRCVCACPLCSGLAGYAHQSARVVWADCERGELEVGVSAWRDVA